MWLGKSVAAPERYDPSVLTPIPRVEGRKALRLPPAWFGEDVWHLYELSWLDAAGEPVSAWGRLIVPADSPNLVESKSLKLYFNGLNFERFASPDALVARVEADLAAVVDAPVRFEVYAPETLRQPQAADFGDPASVSLDAPMFEEKAGQGELAADAAEVSERFFAYDARHLAVLPAMPPRWQSFRTARFRSVCPVTGQPDWASLYLRAFGPPLEVRALRQYLSSFRRHPEFHEQCVERIYCDLWALGMTELMVVARFLRRGGIDINPQRASRPDLLWREFIFDPRQ